MGPRVQGVRFLGLLVSRTLNPPLCWTASSNKPGYPRSAARGNFFGMATVLGRFNLGILFEFFFG